MNLFSQGCYFILFIIFAMIPNLMAVLVLVPGPPFLLLMGPLFWGQGFLLKGMNVQKLFS